MTIFDERKKRILGKLRSDEPDLSPKGKPDDDILELLELINGSEDYVSTSSCSGRAVVFLDADKDGQGSNAKGRWLMNQHSLFCEQFENASIQELHALLFGTSKIGRALVSIERPSRVVTLKFEPLIVHILCRNLSSAASLLHIATASGFRESGVSISATGTQQEKIVVAIRTTAIRLDVPLASYDGDTQEIRHFGLSRDYLVNLLSLINDKFQENELRRRHLYNSLEKSLRNTMTNSETKDERKIRKRAEGMKQQAIRSHQQENADHGQQILETYTSDEYLHLDQLITL